MSGERRTPPSARRLRKARDEGKVAFSPEPAAALTLLTFVLATVAIDPVAPLAPLLASLLESMPATGSALLQAGLTLARAVLPCLLGAALLGVGLGLLQTRGLVTLGPLRPDPGRLSPAAGFKRLVSLDRLFPALRGLALTLLGLPLLAVVALELAPTLVRLPLRAGGSPGAIATLLLSRVLGVGVGLLTLSALVDLLWRRHRLGRSLFTTEQEGRDEHRREEGDPQHRQQRKQRHRQLALSTPPPLREAKVLLLNPTRLTVALHHESLDTLPYVGSTATGIQAARMRARARRTGVPLLRDRALARALFALEPGDEIPASLYAPVAALLAGLYRAGLARPPTASGATNPTLPAPHPRSGETR